ncbi:uncharacterized protein LOC6582271 [Drosophila mojavensis]|uniref:MD-2-related lipid-recognition domain-containing protein n=1 Tax=Drosophila mojavensis TaxID=7230 RepID=B4KVS6_DROMO|nr:uncharacterized protein LOC6582271 [Drosophila mojavensis]EDW18450.1 uncharacterized protein Dmoj_GI12082 [Drosophila mojavensis]
MWKLLIVVLIACTAVRCSHFKLNNVICRCYDTAYCTFKQCELTIRRRGMAAFSMYTVLHKRPVDNIYINLELFKKSNGYRSYLINQSIDFCYYMRNPKAYIFFHAFHKTFVAVSNFNHTCPYDHDIIINRFIYERGSMIDLPLPNGEYMINVKLSVSKIWRAELKIFVTRSD